MAAVNKVTVFLSGKLDWAKILGNPIPNYNGDGREWKFEFTPDEAGLQKIIQNGLADRIKGKGYNIGMKGQHKDREPFLSFKKSEFSKEGNPNPPIRVYNGDDEAWDQTVLIGNGSSADLKLDIRDYGAGKKKGAYPQAIRVTELVPYQSSEFGGMDRADEDAVAPAKARKLPGKTVLEALDDEMPL